MLNKIIIGIALLMVVSVAAVAQTVAPVTLPTPTVSVGTWASEALTWAVTIFGGAAGTALTALLFRLFQAAGIKATDDLRARLNEIVVNGLNLAAKEAEAGLVGKGKIQIDTEIKKRALQYVQSHGAETIQALGLAPNSPAALEAIKAKIETAIADPATPTPPVLGGPPVVAPIPVKST